MVPRKRPLRRPGLGLKRTAQLASSDSKAPLVQKGSIQVNQRSRNLNWAPPLFTGWRARRNHMKSLARPTGWPPCGRRVGALRAPRLEAVALQATRFEPVGRLKTTKAPQGAFSFSGAPDRIRTCDPCLRRAVLYPAELRARREQ